MTTAPQNRSASRLVVIDADGRILLFQYEDERGRWWATPGGGLENAETFEEAAVREAAEELGLAELSLEEIWERTTEFTSRGQLFRQTERYFRVVTAGDAVTFEEDVRAAHATEGIIAARWWSHDEISATTERIFPEDLAERFRQLGATRK